MKDAGGAEGQTTKKKDERPPTFLLGQGALPCRLEWTLMAEGLPKSGASCRALRTAPHMHVLEVWMVKKNYYTRRRQPHCPAASTTVRLQ
jgi:hypothetical protein